MRGSQSIRREEVPLLRDGHRTKPARYQAERPAGPLEGSRRQLGPRADSSGPPSRFPPGASARAKEGDKACASEEETSAHE